LDEDWFILDAHLLRDALEIALVDQAHQFVSPPSGDAIMDFVNQLGYTGEIHFVSRMALNNLYQPWRGRNHNIHQRSTSLLNLAEDDLRLGNLKFVPKGKIYEVFGMQIPKELITNNIMNAPYYNDYLEMVVKHDKKIEAEEGGKIKSSSKADKSKKLVSKGKVGKVRKGKCGFQLVDVEEEAEHKPEPEPQDLHKPQKRSTTDQFIIQRRTPSTLEESTGPSTQLQDDTSANIIRESPSPADAETGANSKKTNNKAGTEVLKIDEEKGEELSNTVALEEKTVELDEG
nr:hypothetical protein [Tanacetum cinerariifolium]